MKNFLLPLIGLVLVIGVVSWMNLYENGDASFQKISEFNGAVRTESTISQTNFQQSVDHLSDDARAMSPRHWGGLQNQGPFEPVAPPISASAFPGARPLPTGPTLTGPGQFVDGTARPPYGQVEFGRDQQPPQYYETTPIQPGFSGGHQPGYSTPIPPGGFPVFDSIQGLRGLPSAVSPRSTGPVPRASESLQPKINETQPSKRPAADPGDAGIELPMTPSAFKTPSATEVPPLYGQNRIDAGTQRAQQQNPAIVVGNDYFGSGVSEIAGPVCGDCARNYPLDSRETQSRHGRRAFNGRQRGDRHNDDCGCQYPMLPQPEFNPNLGHRNAENTVRAGEYQGPDQFDFDAKTEHFPPMREILRQAVYFGQIEFGLVQPSFQGNSAITQTGPASGSSSPFDFNYDPMPRFYLGFESEYGPGFEIGYFQFDQDSDLDTFTSNGIITGTTSLYQLGPNQWTSISATAAGEALNAKHSLDVDSITAMAFKPLKFRRSSLVGRLGIQYVRIQQELDARLFNPGGTEISRLLGTSTLNAFGPKIGVDYIRPVGHTKLELIASASGSVLFGNRNQNVSNSYSNEFSSLTADDILTIVDIFSGIQSRFMRGEKRNTFIRLGYINQSWIGGGTGIDPSGNFGLQGVTLALGVNR